MRDAMPGRALRSVAKVASIVAVSVYLTAVGCFLVVTRRIRVSPRKFAGALGRRLLARFGPPFSIEVAEVAHEKGHCYVAPLGKKLISDFDGRSRLTLFEDGRALPYPHSTHDDIRELGAGRYSHWGEVVFFSSSDNTDPSRNGRRYSAREA
jgi:pectate lyase